MDFVKSLPTLMFDKMPNVTWFYNEVFRVVPFSYVIDLLLTRKGEEFEENSPVDITFI